MQGRREQAPPSRVVDVPLEPLRQPVDHTRQREGL
jgi:hypothetical protein